ncbi:MAG: DUF1127 domain-containing protein [Boseongicola sp.]|nr:DUF1127 domain-containing protein [Boseongicola sp.]
MSVMDIFARDRRPVRSATFGGLTQRVRRYRTYRQTVEELERLTDRELTDLNISRSMIRSIAYRAAYDG